MARKKATKKTSVKIKKNNKTQKKSTVKAVKMSLSQQMEKSFKDLPNELLNQYKKESASNKQQETKIEASIKKAANSIKVLGARCAKLAKSKNASAKKQLAAAKQNLQKLTNTVKELTNELHAVKEQSKSLTGKQKMMTALSKEIGQFEKAWAVSVKAAAKKAAVKAKKKTRKKAAAPLIKDEEISPEETIEDVIAPQEIAHNTIVDTQEEEIAEEEFEMA